MAHQLTVDEVLVSADRDLMTVLAIGFALLVLIQTAIGALRGWLLLHLTNSLSLQVLTQLFSHLLRLPLAFFEKRHVGDLLSRFASMDAIQRTLTGSSLEVLIDGVLAISMFIVMAIYNLHLTFVVLLVAVLYALLRWALFRPMREAVNEQLVFAAQQQTHFIESLRGIQAIKLHMGEADRPVALAERGGGHAERQHPRADAHAHLQDGELRAVRPGERADCLAGCARGDGGRIQRRHAARVLCLQTGVRDPFVQPDRQIHRVPTA